MKCFTYVFARTVLSELYTVLIIPSDHNNALETRLMENLNENGGRLNGNDGEFSISSSGNLSFIEYGEDDIQIQNVDDINNAVSRS
jgi:hypothetical protein